MYNDFLRQKKILKQNSPKWKMVQTLIRFSGQIRDIESSLTLFAEDRLTGFSHQMVLCWVLLFNGHTTTGSSRETYKLVRFLACLSVALLPSENCMNFLWIVYELFMNYSWKVHEILTVAYNQVNLWIKRSAGLCTLSKHSRPRSSDVFSLEPVF